MIPGKQFLSIDPVTGPNQNRQSQQPKGHQENVLLSTKKAQSPSQAIELRGIYQQSRWLLAVRLSSGFQTERRMNTEKPGTESSPSTY